MNPNYLPSEAGTYAVRLSVPQPRRLIIGRLGVLNFPAGQYLYIGSAFGPGGLRARIAHHMRRALKPHWHLDYLRQICTVAAVWYVVGRRMECQWAGKLCHVSGVVPIRGFGCSDCNCYAHLFNESNAQPDSIAPAVLGNVKVWHARS